MGAVLVMVVPPCVVLLTGHQGEHEADCSRPVEVGGRSTRNTGYANAVAALDAGVVALDASTGGFGGCPFAPAATGNIATEDLVYLLSRTGVHTGVDREAIEAAAAELARHLGKDAPALLGRAGGFPTGRAG